MTQILLEQGSITSIAERMQGYQVIAMVILLGYVLGTSPVSRSPCIHTSILFFFVGFSVYLVNKSQKSSDKPKHQYGLLCCRPKLKHVQEQVKENVKKMMSEQLRVPSTNFGGYRRGHSSHCLSKPAFVASCSSFGPKVLLFSHLLYHFMLSIFE